jgi:CRP-like cAMP-binding protein
MKPTLQLTVRPMHLEWLAEALKLPEAMAQEPALETLLESLSAISLEAWPAAAEVLREGEMGEDFFVVYSGKLSVSHLDSRGASRALGTLKKGDFFGEISFLMTSARSATVRTDADCRLFRFSAKEFHGLLKRHHLLEDWVREVADERLQKIFLAK